MKERSRRKLDKMHVWTHRRFHDAKKPECWRYWLAVRTRIQELMKEVKLENTDSGRSNSGGRKV